MLTCDQHDYVEIACMYRYPVTVTLHDGQTVSGNAKDTRYNANRQHCLILQADEEEIWLVLDELRALSINKPNPHFRDVKFGE